MKASDIAKLAAGIAAGSLAYDAALGMLDDDGDASVLDRLLASGAGVVGGSIGAKFASEIMDETGISDTIDELFDW